MLQGGAEISLQTQDFINCQNCHFFSFGWFWNGLNCFEFIKTKSTNEGWTWLSTAVSFVLLKTSQTFVVYSVQPGQEVWHFLFVLETFYLKTPFCTFDDKNI